MWIEHTRGRLVRNLLFFFTPSLAVTINIEVGEKTEKITLELKENKKCKRIKRSYFIVHTLYIFLKREGVGGGRTG